MTLAAVLITRWIVAAYDETSVTSAACSTMSSTFVRRRALAMTIKEPIEGGASAFHQTQHRLAKRAGIGQRLQRQAAGLAQFANPGFRSR